MAKNIETNKINMYHICRTYIVWIYIHIIPHSITMILYFSGKICPNLKRINKYKDNGRLHYTKWNCQFSTDLFDLLEIFNRWHHIVLLLHLKNNKIQRTKLSTYSKFQCYESADHSKMINTSVKNSFFEWILIFWTKAVIIYNRCLLHTCGNMKIM